MNARRRIAAAAVVLAAPLLSSCGVNFGAQTDQVYNPAVGVNDRTGDVYVLNALVVSGGNGSGTVVATLTNNNQNRPDALKSVQGAGKDAGITAQMGGDTTIPPDGLLNLATQGAISVSGQQIKPGYFVTLTYTFDHARAVTLDVPVVSSSNPDYAGIKVPSAPAS